MCGCSAGQNRNKTFTAETVRVSGDLTHAVEDSTDSCVGLFLGKRYWRDRQINPNASETTDWRDGFLRSGPSLLFVAGVKLH